MKAHYHQHGKHPQEYTVLKKHDDGTIDLGPEGGEPVVTRCPVAEEPVPGSATLITAKKAEAKADDAEKTKEKTKEDSKPAAKAKGAK